MKKAAYLTILILFTQLVNAQTSLNVFVEADSISGLPGLQSFAYAQSQGKWLLLGGRTDGLHRRQPPFAFLASENNTIIYVVDPATKQTWTATLTQLPILQQEQLQSTNMQFIQKDSMLYLIGGYGYSSTSADHITYPYLIVMNVNQVMQAIINNQPFAAYIKQVFNNNFAVTGGHLNTIGDVFYLVGGHRFDGRYNPMNGPSFVQTYTNQVRKFQLTDSSGIPAVFNYSTITDNVNLHRRDYNLAPQIFPNGQFGFTVFSGVFQQTADLPYLNTVDIDSNGYYVNNTFNQYLSHYHSANAALYDSQQNEMHTLFFGGMAQYTLSTAGVLVQNDSVPFVKTISKVTRNASGVMNEIKLGEMPDLLGASAELILNETMPLEAEGIIDLDQLAADTSLIGYILGGIKSSQPNIFWINTGNESSASAVFYKVYLVKNQVSALSELSVNNINPLNITVYPNPADDLIVIKYNIGKLSKATFVFQSADGRLLETLETKELNPGIYETSFNLKQYKAKQIIVTVSDGLNLVTEKIIIQ